MHSIILSTATRYLLPLLLMFSIFLLLRGHNEPGGGFVGGLVAAAALTLYALALGLRPARQVLEVDPRTLISFGLLAAAVSGLPALFGNMDFMTGLWGGQALPVIGKLGTPLLFDVGVYLVVTGITLTIIFALLENQTGQRRWTSREGVTMEILMVLMIGGLFAGGSYMLLRRSLVKLVVGLILLGHGANLLIFLMGRLTAGQAPLIAVGATRPVEPFADPLPQALVLTAIVIGFGLQVFALVLVRRLYQAARTNDLDQLRTTET